MRVFIQNEADSRIKNYHDEKICEWKRSVEVLLPYPFPYGFVIGTTAADGCNVDCFVITDQALKSGTIVECEALGLMEQFEDGHPDHNVLAAPVGEQGMIDDTIHRVLSEFVSGVFAGVPGKQMAIGRFLGRDEALAHVAAHQDRS